MRKSIVGFLIILTIVASACSIKNNRSVTSSPFPSITSPKPVESPTNSNVNLTILYTDDEHGWMAGMEAGSGAAEMIGLWRSLDNYGSNDHLLVLSGGDNWTGPAISTWFNGEGMVEVMNSMDYDASAIGNHEFDFGLDILKARIAEAGFPYLSANLRYKANGQTPIDLGIQPFTLVDAGGLSVGVIGLSTLSTPLTTNPSNLVTFEFIDYAEALRQVIPEVRNAGAKLVVVIAHVCPDELENLARQVKDLNIPFIGGGHCHQPYSSKANGTVILVGGANLVGYGYVQLSVDPASGATTIQDYGLRKNKGGEPDPEVAKIIQSWQTRTDAELNKEIGFLQNDIPQGSQEMQALITETWLIGYPNADIAITNLGGLRDRLPAGSLTLADIVSMLPFDNYLVEVKLTGKQVEKVLSSTSRTPAIGGVHRSGSQWILNKTGQPLQVEETYSVLVNDFMYAGGDGYTLLAQYDPNAYNTGIDWRQPVIDWILAQKSSPTKHLDSLIRALIP
jgi:5'-nucleotidase/UDP-sugar diphosphatase